MCEIRIYKKSIIDYKKNGWVIVRNFFEKKEIEKIKHQILDKISKTKKNDYFINDPTLYFSGSIENIKLNIEGIYTSESIMEVEIIFKNLYLFLTLILN